MQAKCLALVSNWNAPVTLVYIPTAYFSFKVWLKYHFHKVFTLSGLGIISSLQKCFCATIGTTKPHKYNRSHIPQSLCKLPRPSAEISATPAPCDQDSTQHRGRRVGAAERTQARTAPLTSRVRTCASICGNL